MGFNPFAPLYNHMIQRAHPDIDSEFEWLEIDKVWLSHCDIMTRLHFKDNDGNEILSPGANEEEKFATETGIPIFHFNTLEEMVRGFQTIENTI